MKARVLLFTVMLVMWRWEEYFVQAKRVSDEIYTEHFKSADINGDGFIDMQEVRSMLLDIGGENWRTTERGMYDSLKKFDANSDGLSLIDAQELRALLGDLAEHHLDAYFRKTDTNKDGAVSWTEFVGDALSEDGKA
ncbi:hypothetical protein FOZ63_015732 [Perkinsus olseni]|uniref:EF-hand domain-containing protein n=1 Tax=Perkinsus olseni TaxID=32597 RepID=A0A7J6RCI2_PEROL|nr:hypothetical protein FOZ63_015732 [Perkinsus olseni]